MSHLHHKVSTLIDGELQGAARRRALAHARLCTVCQRELEQTYALKQRLLGLAAAEPPADLFAALGSVRATRDAEPAGTSKVAIARRALVGAGSMSLAVVTLAYIVGGSEPAAPAVSPPVEEFSAEFAESTGLQPLSDPAVEAFGSGPVPRRTRAMSAAVTQPVSFSATRTVSRDRPLALRWLHRAAMAPSRFAYSGVRRVSWSAPSGASSVTLDVEHAPQQGTSYAVAGGSDDAAGTFIGQSEAASAGVLGGKPVDLLITSYDVSIGGHDVVDGREAIVVMASREGEAAARFWIDEATGLLLKREMYDGGRLIRVSELSELQTSAAGFMKHLPPELESPAATRLSTDYALTLTDKGWACPPNLPSDFSLTLLHRTQGTPDVVHAAYSDGLSTASIFEERGDLDTDAVADYRRVTSDDSTVWVREGLPTVVVWQAADTVYTLVTDAPPSTTAELVAALPHEPDSESAASRVGRGLTKIGSSVNPGD